MFLLTNDDGIDAPGLAALAEATRGMPRVIVAPRDAMSECSHCVTTRKSFSVESRQCGEEIWYAVEGTPADCVRVAILQLLPRHGVAPNDVRVLSGINAGGNLGADVYISGTVAAVREAAFFGVPGVAFSQYRRGVPDDAQWRRAAAWARRTLEHLRESPLQPGEFWNVNFPWAVEVEAPPIVICERSRRPLPVKYEQVDGQLQYVAGLYHTRDYEPGSDIDVCFSGRISASRIAI